jgi:hypothetical protein
MRWYRLNSIELYDGEIYCVMLKNRFVGNAKYEKGVFTTNGEKLNVIAIFK